MNPEEFYTHALRAADAEGRLPLSRITAWDVFPFEQTGLRVVPLNPPVLPEPAGPARSPPTVRPARPAGRRSGRTRTGGCRYSGRPAPR